MGRLGLESSTLGLKVADKVSDMYCRVRVCPAQSMFCVQPVLPRAGRYQPVRETIRETRGRRKLERDSSSLPHGLRNRRSPSDFLCPKVQSLAATGPVMRALAAFANSAGGVLVFWRRR